MALPIDNFVDYIYNDDRRSDNKVIYIGVGSAAHMSKVIDNKRYIDSKDDQQYPIFLRDIVLKKRPDTYIILIDPMLEKPCFTVSKNAKDINMDNKLDEGWERHRNYNNIFFNRYENITVMEFRININYLKTDENYNDCICIEDQLDSLNNLAMLEKWFVILMDFTGRYIYDVSVYFDKILDKEIDHIFYGLPSRVDNGCYIDFTNNCNKNDKYCELEGFICTSYIKNIALSVQMAKIVVEYILLSI